MIAATIPSIFSGDFAFVPDLVFIDQLRFLDDLPDAAEAASLLLDLRCRPILRIAAHVVVGIHLRFRPEEKV